MRPSAGKALACSGVIGMAEIHESGDGRRLQLIELLALLQGALLVVDRLDGCAAIGARLQNIIDDVQVEIAAC